MSRSILSSLAFVTFSLFAGAAPAQSFRAPVAARIGAPALRPASRLGASRPIRLRARTAAVRRARADTTPRFNGEPVESLPDLHAFVAGHASAPSTGRVAAHAQARGLARLASNAHLLVPGGTEALGEYTRMAVTPSHVVMVRRSGTIDVVRSVDAETQIARGTPVSRQRVAITRVGNTFLSYEPGPGDTVRLYRQLPAAAAGDIASTTEFTSFALGNEAAFHLFGPTGASVCLAVPRSVYEGAVAGTMGGTGWSGGGLGIDELTEVQISSRVVRELTAGASRSGATATR